MSQERFVHILDEVPEFDDLPEGPVLLTAMEGFLDAGNASARATVRLLEEDAGRVVASFDIDEFYDYRARRPPMSFVEDHYADYDPPRLVVRAVHDSAGTPYLLLTGPEPDMRWEGFLRSLREVVEHFGVRLTVGLGSVPMAVPHTRPVQLTNHATSPELLVSENVWRGEIRIPSSAQSLLELRLGEWGHDSVGFVAHIPHYVAQGDYPEAAAALLRGVGEATGLHWDLDALEEAAAARRAEIDGQVSDSEEVRNVVSGLEQQYDAFLSATNLLADDSGELPTGEELGAQFEQFLAGLDGPEEH